MAASDLLHQVLERIVTLISSVVECDSCFIYILEDDELVLRASKNPHPEAVDRLKLRVGQGITGWVAEHLEPVALARDAFQDPRFNYFSELPEDRYEAFLSVPILCRGRVVGVINLQHRLPHVHSPRDIKLISTIGFLVGAEIERARLESEVSQLSGRLEMRKTGRARQGHPAARPRIKRRRRLSPAAAAKPADAQVHERSCRGGSDQRRTQANPSNSERDQVGLLIRKSLGKEMAPQVGLEPTTLRLTAGCSAIELLRSTVTVRPSSSRRITELSL